MALYIDIRVNERVIATAAVQNIEKDDRDVCDYRGHAWTDAFGDRPIMRHDLDIRQHDRRSSVWTLVGKIALALARKETA